MKKRLLSLLTSLALCLGVMGGAAFADEVTAEPGPVLDDAMMVDPAEGATTVLPPVYTWGTIEIQEDGSLYLTNDDEENLYNEVIIRISEETAVVDGETGNPMNASDLEDGSIIHVWLGNAMTMSLPPQATAKVIIANVPEESTTPKYYEISSTEYTYDEDNETLASVMLFCTDGTELEISKDIQLFPYRTKNIVGLDSLIPYGRIIVWTDAEENIEKVMVLPYEENNEEATAEAASVDEENAAADEQEQPSPLAPVLAWGTVQVQEDGSLYIINEDETVINNEIVVRLGEDTPIVDAATGDSMPASDIKDGSTVYAWLENAMTLSLPPQANAIVIVANVTEGSEVPEFYQIANAEYTYDETDSSITSAALKFTDGTSMDISKDIQLFPYMTKNIVTLDSLVPGTKILVWKNAEENIEKVMVFAYEYSGYLNIKDDVISISGEELPVKGQMIGEIFYAPLRSVAENAGYEVTWTKEDGAGILKGEDEVVTLVLPDAETVQTPEGETSLTGKCMLDNDTTYIPVLDLSYFLNLFYIK